MRRWWLLPACLAAWTVFVAVAVWWLSSEGGAAAWVSQDNDHAQAGLSAWVRDWLRLVHVNFQRAYPWILLAPYAVCLAIYLPLERRRLAVKLAAHLAGAAVFATAAYEINAHTNGYFARVVIVKSNWSSHGTNMLGMGIAQSGHLVQEERSRTFGVGGSGGFGRLPDMVTVHSGGLKTNGAETNLSIKVEQGFRPSLHAPALPSMQPFTTALDVLAYAAVVGLAHAVHFYGRYRERERRTLFLESNLAKARLGALQAQLQPHFLFNSLNAIATLLRRDPKAAEATLMSLSELLRLTLKQSDKQEVRLGEELEFVERYLAIQQTRFGDRLRWEQSIDPAAVDCLVPTLLLQPLVENAIRHGIEPIETAGRVRITAARSGSRLVLGVEDDGVGLSDAAVGNGQSQPGRAAALGSQSHGSGNGIGLANLRARLGALYSDDQKLELRPRAEGGTSAIVELPWHTDLVAEAEDLP